PHPPDTVFRRAAAGEFDAVVAMYHDQGHIPIKMIEFDSAVNLTLGLPILRTSPDHGTAFDIAGKGTVTGRSRVAGLAAWRAVGISGRRNSPAAAAHAGQQTDHRHSDAADRPGAALDPLHPAGTEQSLRSLAR